jgi:hypothetical protein
MQQDVHAAESALRHFQSCVRTTLLLSNGYECQEKVHIVLACPACTHRLGFPDSFSYLLSPMITLLRLEILLPNVL